MARRDTEQMLETIRGLLAKAESTDFEAEAEAFTAKAQELMAAHSIETAMLERGREGDGVSPTSVTVKIHRPYAQPKMHLLSAAAGPNHCRVLWNRYKEEAVVFGFDNDIAAVELLFTSLLVQATRAMTAHGPQTDWSGRSRTRSFRRSFLLGFADRIGWRLREASARSAQEAEATYGSSMAPVLAERDERVAAAVRDQHPHVATLRTSNSNVSGWFAGEDAADRADLGDRQSIDS